MFTPSSKRQRIAQRLGDAGTDQQMVGYSNGLPITVDNLPNGVSEDVPSSVFITPGQFTNYVPDSVGITPGAFDDYVPPSVYVTPSPMQQTNDTASVIAAVGSAVQSGVSAYQAIQLQNLQIARINAGLPPLTAAQMAAAAGQLPAQSGSMDTTTMLLLGGGALLLLMVAMKKKKAH